MWNPFRKKPAMTSDAYRRWLRAHAPQPLDFFMGLGELEQETLAMLGEEYDEDINITLAYAIKNPGAAAKGVIFEESGGDLEEALALRLSADLAQTSATRKTPTMSGVFQRRDAVDLAAQQAKQKGKVLFGKAPDEVVA